MGRHRVWGGGFWSGGVIGVWGFGVGGAMGALLERGVYIWVFGWGGVVWGGWGMYGGFGEGCRVGGLGFRFLDGELLGRGAWVEGGI